MTAGRLLDGFDRHPAILGNQRQKFHEPHRIEDIPEARVRVEGMRIRVPAGRAPASDGRVDGQRVQHGTTYQHCGSFKEKKPSAISQQTLSARPGVA